MKYTYILLSLFLVSLSAGFAQPSKSKNQIEYINSLQITSGLGTATYYGDLCENMDCATVFRPSTSVGLIYRNSDRMLFRFETGYYQLYGNDANGKNFKRNLHFRSNNFETMASVIYDFIPYERKFVHRAPVTPYGVVAMGMTVFSPKAELNGKWVKLRPLETEGKRYSNITAVSSFGVGGRFKVNPMINLSYEVAYRFTLTDYMDDVSTTYVNNASLEGDAAILADRTDEIDFTINNRDYDQTNNVWNAGHKRGNPARRDGYMMMMVKMEYRIMWTAQGGSILRKSKFK